METIIEQLTALFQETGEAHHAAFADSGGVDPEWPIWYADYLYERLVTLLEVSFTKSELIYLIVMADGDLRQRAPGARWPAYYARFFAARYG